jgi:nucleoside-diphosphate-sugar epimerase
VLTNEINVAGTLNVLTAARERGVKRVVFASSSSVYGDSLELPKNEAMIPSPKSPYALQKLTGEFYCRLFYELYGVETVSLRYFNVFGPRQDPASTYAAVIPKFITALLNGKKPVVFGDGKQTRDFTYIDNVVQANKINVACRRRYSLLDLLSSLEDITGKRAEPEFKPPMPGDVRDSLADISLAQRLLDFKITVGFLQGLEKTVNWYEKTGKKGF